ncbi:MAG: D-alanyl-D-alanine carboxypeptidase family protein [Solirubrobacterales bacterium]
MTGCRRQAVAAALATVATFAIAGQATAAEMVTRTLSGGTAVVRTPAMPTGVTARSATVTDAATGRALWSIRPDEKRLIASTTKIMTALVAISRTSPDEQMAATTYRATPGESRLGLRAGELMTAKDLIAALLLESANDAADTLAVRTAGSRAKFVAAMNRRARQIGMPGTNFGNPIGLDSPRTVSTASDLAALTKVAMREPRFSGVVGLKQATLRSGSKVRRIRNRNDLVGRYAYVDGVKTGHTVRAGYLLVGSATKGDARVISVVMGEPSVAARNRDSLKILRFGRGFFKNYLPVSRRRALARLPIDLQDATAAVYPRRDIGFALRDGERYSVTMTAAEKLAGPIAAGARIGTARVTRNGREVAETAVVVREAIPEPPIQAVLLDTVGRLMPLILLLAIVFIIGVLILRRRATAPSGSADRLSRSPRPPAALRRP